MSVPLLSHLQRGVCVCTCLYTTGHSLSENAGNTDQMRPQNRRYLLNISHHSVDDKLLTILHRNNMDGKVTVASLVSVYILQPPISNELDMYVW